MKKLFFIASLFALFLLSSCSSSDMLPDLNKANKLYSHLENKPYCDNSDDEAFARRRTGDTKEIEIWHALESFDIKYSEGDSLSLYHKNCTLHCASALDVECFYDEESRTIVVNEYDKFYDYAMCLCKFDIASKVGPLTNGTYRLVVFSGVKMGEMDRENYQKNFDYRKRLDVTITFDKNLHKIYEQRFDGDDFTTSHIEEVDSLMGRIAQRYKVKEW